MRRTYSASGVEQAAQSVSRAGQDRSGPASEQFFSALSRSRNLPICILLPAFRPCNIIRKSLAPRCEQFFAVNFYKLKKRDLRRRTRSVSLLSGWIRSPWEAKEPTFEWGSAGVPGESECGARILRAESSRRRRASATGRESRGKQKTPLLSGVCWRSRRDSNPRPSA